MEKLFQVWKSHSEFLVALLFECVECFLFFMFYSINEIIIVLSYCYPHNAGV